MGGGWNDTLLWYARAVEAMQARPINDPTSWRYFAAMHGIDTGLWQFFSYLSAKDKLPPNAEQKIFWQQCQHQTWYFLPWHRGYLAAFEAVLRAAIAKLGGPADWALPYWNYNNKANPKANTLHPVFRDAKTPDKKPNPLAVEARFGTDGKGNVTLDPSRIALGALREKHFQGASQGGTAGFGGPETTFSHSGSTNGQLENQPHNIIHSLVGGGTRDSSGNSIPGLMSTPVAAALDPIFWIHHSNIDRLWEVWLNRDPQNKNPTDSKWLDGPKNRKFEMPDPHGKGYQYKPSEMLDTKSPKLDYIYDDVSDPLGGVSPHVARLNALFGAKTIATATGVTAVTKPGPAEMIGANDAAVSLGKDAVETRVRFDAAASQRMARSFTAHGVAANLAAGAEPDRVYLNLENIKGANDAAVFDVYVNLPEGAEPRPEYLAGAVSLFGVAKASRKDDEHAGNGINQVLEITHVVDALHLNDALNLAHLMVRFVPRSDVQAQDKISVGKVSVYRQSQS